MVELGHTDIVKRAVIRGEEMWDGASFLCSQKGNDLADVRTFVLLARHGAQPLLSFPQYTILVRANSIVLMTRADWKGH